MKKTNLAAAADYPQQSASKTLPSCWRRTTPPVRRQHVLPSQAVKDLAAYVERHSPHGGFLARLIGLDTKYDADSRWRLRIECEHHGAQVPTRDHRCPYCPNAEEGETATFPGPVDYAAYLLDEEID